MPKASKLLVRPVAVCLIVTTIGASTRASDEEISRPSSESPTERFQAVVAEWEAARTKYFTAVENAKSELETADARKLSPDRLGYSQRVLSIAESKVDDATSRDALLWIINHPGVLQEYHGALADLEQRAVQILLDRHADDPKVARLALNLNNFLSPARDALLEGLVDKARDREPQAVARVALARYLMRRADVAQAQQALTPAQRAAREQRAARDKNDAAHAAYSRSMASYDVAKTRRKTEGLLEEVIAKYGDVPLYSESAQRTAPRLRKTLGQFAEGLLDEIRNLAIGKPSPEIDGVGLDGQPLKLSDYRGKVVVLVFWGSWCGPCVADIPHERELVERLKGRPFVLLGVDCDEDPAAGRKVIESENVNWHNWYEPFGNESDGPLVERFHVRRFPSTFVLDAEGIICAKNSRGVGLDQVVDKLVLELESRASQ
ncbi:MAG TPA: TlpA disulfide reductase family protein [Pirellulales bacterium]|jgi:thiol-disulfide isomerase/thioredoxin|nr:TlpA disulfide reductase family protein [Pirellulales bacterium]